MNDHATTSKRTVLGTWSDQGRVSRVTLALLLTTTLQDSRIAGHTSGLARLSRAIDGLSSSVRDYEQAELIASVLAEHQSMSQIWLTQSATALGFLIGSGVDPSKLRSSRKRLAETQRTWGARLVIDVADFTTKRERSRILTRRALGGGKFNRDTPMETLWEWLYREETILRNGWQLT
jgi:hypothetical protein